MTRIGIAAIATCVILAAFVAAAFTTPSASAITPTPTYTNTATPGPSLTRVYTNATGAPADALDLVIFFAAVPLGVSVNAPGCSAPTLVFVPGTPVEGITPAIAQFRWPSPCVDPGEFVTVQFAVLVTFPNAQGTFFDQSLATATPTPTATSTTPTSTPVPGLEASLDCNLAEPGIQSACEYPVSVGTIDVGIVMKNVSGANTSLGAIGIDVHNTDTTRLVPLPGLDANRDANPDFNDVELGTVLTCTPPSPVLDTGENGAGTSTSYIGCYYDGGFLPFTDGASLLFAVVHYQVPVSAQPGDVSVLIEELATYDDSFSDIGSCVNVIGVAALCENATITLMAAPRIAKIPEGNANNADLSVPKANLWICVAPAACSGPGEGGLRVVERATGVVTGDQNGDTIDDGVGAYEFTVEYDNFVIQSVNPCDIVFGAGGAGSARGPVDEVNASVPNNADCVPDPGIGANGTCANSFILENLVRFGCVTGGQTPGPNGDFDLASLELIPHPDLRNDLFPGNENGVITVIKDNGCELVDVFGHPVEGSVNGGLTQTCGDLAVTVRILEGDIDLDCEVELNDLQAIATHFGGVFGDLLYSKWLDLEPATHDLDIDIKDLQKVFGRDGSTCQDPVPLQPPADPPAPFGD